MTIQEAREKIAQKWKYKNWLDLHIKVGGTEMDAFFDEAAELYARWKVKNLSLPHGVKLLDCPECGAEIQFGISDKLKELMKNSKLFKK